jgi:hypothetical protein
MHLFAFGEGAPLLVVDQFFDVIVLLQLAVAHEGFVDLLTISQTLQKNCGGSFEFIKTCEFC